MVQKFLITAASLALASAITAPACAQDAADSKDAKGVYVELNAGVASVSDIDIAYFDEGGTFGGTGASDSADFEAELGSAATFGGAIGYDFGIIRTDLRVDYSRNQVKSLTLKSINGSAVTLTPADGAEICDYLETDSCSVSGNKITADGSRARQLSALANIWFDVPLGGAVTPYVGGGVGISGYELDGEGNGRFAWQLGAGVSFDITPHVALTADFRHRQTSGSTIVDEEFEDAGVRIGKVKTNSFTAGVRFRF